MNSTPKTLPGDAAPTAATPSVLKNCYRMPSKSSISLPFFLDAGRQPEQQNRSHENSQPRTRATERHCAAFGNHPDYDYEAILQRAEQMPRAKGKRFAEGALEQWQGENGFLARALNDTAYLSRIAKEYLSSICPPNRVRAIPGRMTAMLRGKFGLNQLLSGSEIKNRDDHRHHALDAAVIAITDQGLLQQIR